MFYSGLTSKSKRKISFPPPKFPFKPFLQGRSVLDYLRYAAGIAAKRKSENQGFYVGAVGIRSDGAIVRAFNGSANHPIARGHAEARLVNKLDVGSIVYVARYSFGTHNLALAKPCKNCESLLISHGVKKIYYSICDNEYGTMIL